jgi:hypothetical protein
VSRVDHMANLRTDRTLRSNLVKTSLKKAKPSLLFILAVEQFRDRPNKKRAVAIYDVFIRKSGYWDEGLGEFNPKDRERVAVLNHMGARMDWFQELRDEAEGMNPLKRWWTSGNRAVAYQNEFDMFVERAKLNNPSGMSGQLGELINPGRANAFKVFEQPGWLETAQRAKKTLKDAGFDVDRLGLIDIT